MPAALEFLVVDDHRDNRFLLAKTLHRRFPHARIEECSESDAAVAAASRPAVAAVVIHGVSDQPVLEVIARLRALRRNLPILYVTGGDHHRDALEAGANNVLAYDAWLRVGTVVEAMLRPVAGEPSGNLSAR